MSANEKSGPSGPEHFPNLAATIFRAISAATLLHLHFCGLYSGICTYMCCLLHATCNTCGRHNTPMHQ